MAERELIEVRHRRGLWLPEADLWLDPPFGVARAFVSHAHSDHVARHGVTFCSELTGRLMRKRFGAKPDAEFRELGWREPVAWEGWELRLLPAGHIAGSAMLHLTRTRDGATLLYTGDYKLRQGLSSTPCELLPADTLIMETTFGLPEFAFPPPEEVVRQVLQWTRETLEDGGIPVLLGYSLGKAQEILCALAAVGVPVMLHNEVWKMTELLRPTLGALPDLKPFEAANAAGHVLVFPPGAARSLALRKLKVCRTAMLSGWAMQTGARYRYQVDAAFPLSDHADHPELLQTVERVAPRRIWLVHGYTREFAAELRQRGHDAWAIGVDEQLEMGLATAVSAPMKPARGPVLEPETGDVSVAADRFASFALTAERAAAATSRLAKRDLLAGWLRELEGESLALGARYAAGLVFDPADGRGPLQAGWALLRRVLTELAGCSEAEYRALSRTQGDAGRMAFLMLSRRREEGQAGDSLLTEVDAFFQQLRAAAGGVTKVALLKAQLARMNARDGSWLVRLLTGELRMGSREGLIEEAIARAFEQPVEAVREAVMLGGDPGRAALLARARELDEARVRLFVPVKVMLASPEETAEAIWERHGELSGGTLWLEDKFDGIRAQAHREAGRVEIFTRDLKPVAAQFPEVTAALAALDAEVMLDGEIIAYAEDKKLSFFDLQKRLGRRDQQDLFLPSAVSVQFVVFDLLWLNGESLLKQPLRERRARLETLALPPGMRLVEVCAAGSAEAVEAAFLAARRRGNEGLIIKDPASVYSPGRRGKAWLKLKKAFATLDVVVVKAEQGHGKRAHVLSDYTFAVRDEADGALRVIGKAYSGLTDLEIEELTRHFEETTLRQKGRVREVVPEIVLEIAFDSIQASNRHDSGLALRFPRIKAIRRDKTVAEIDTLAYAQRLAGVATDS